jgi:dipeptidyl aminopeptidase/acylaminoacyl peptidase
LKADLRGGDVQTICDVSKTGAVSDWGPDGTILFVENAGAPGIVKRVAAAGGIPVNVGGLPPETGTTRRWRSPQFLPDGERFLALSARSGIARTLYIRSLDGKVRKPLFDVDSKVRFAPPDTIMFVRDGVLMSQRLDMQRLETAGDPIAVANEVHYFKATGASLFDVAESALVYQSKAALNQLVWVDSSGATRGSVSDFEGLQAPAVSPDGTMIAVSVADSKAGVADIWVYDLARGFRNRVTQKPQFESFPIWSPDGKRIVFSTDLGGPPHLHMISLSEPQTVKKLTQPDFIHVSTDWAADGGSIVFTKWSESAGQDIWIVPVTGDGKDRPLIAGDADERDARFSPDSRWIAYTSDETGAAEIYVAAVERPIQRMRVSTSGGKGARWKGDGSELYYINDKSELLSVPVKQGVSIDFGAPRVIARLEGTRAASAEIDEDYTYDPRSDRFLINRANTGRLSVPLEVILNWKSHRSP